MKYTILITEESRGDFRAVVPGLPDCDVHATTRRDALEAVRDLITNFVRRSEVVQLDIAAEPKSGAIVLDTPWEFFGASQNDPTWATLFDRIEDERNTQKS
jgi:predicted RNase H-like HicB family nuclease